MLKVFQRHVLVISDHTIWLPLGLGHEAYTADSETLTISVVLLNASVISAVYTTKS